MEVFLLFNIIIYTLTTESLDEDYYKKKHEDAYVLNVIRILEICKFVTFRNMH